MRKKLNLELNLALKSQNKLRLSTIRLINAAIKDRDISVRTDENASGVADDVIVEILMQMIKQRNDSITHYEEGGRLELAEKETAEINIIKEFLPKQLSEEEVDVAISRAIEAETARSIRDMGSVIGRLKREYSGKMDFSKVAPLVKQRLLRN
tara:strand:+ start:69 stop:527 length:459 start_codon:yes stop_codon:yes gene_type:complete